MKLFDDDVVKIITEKKSNQHNSYKVLPSSIPDAVVWFFFQDVMMHEANNMREILMFGRADRNWPKKKYRYT